MWKWTQSCQEMRWKRARYQRKKVRVQMKDTPGFEQPDQSQNDDSRSPLWTRSRAVKLWDLVSQLSYWTPACEGKRRSPIHGSLQHAFCFRVLTFEGALFSSPPSRDHLLLRWTACPVFMFHPRKLSTQFHYS